MSKRFANSGLEQLGEQPRLTITYGRGPALMMAAGVLFLHRFPNTRERHTEARAAVEVRSGAFVNAQRFL